MGREIKEAYNRNSNVNVITELVQGPVPYPGLVSRSGYTISPPARTTSTKCEKVRGLDIWWGCGRMVGMNKIKYWLLVVAALVKAFTSPILLFGSAFVTQGSVLSDVLLVLGICSIGWVNDIKLPEKPVND